MGSRLHAPSYSTSSSSTFTSPPTSPLLGYTETDPFLASRSGQLEPPPSPGSRSRPGSPSPYERSFSPGILDHLVIPPQAKRQRSKGTLLLAFAALAFVVVLMVHAADGLGSLPAEEVQVVSGKLRKSLNGFRDAWMLGGSGAEVGSAEDEALNGGTSSEDASGQLEDGQSSVEEGGERRQQDGAGSAETNFARFNVSAFPRTRRPSGGPGEKFIGYLPHSGFHNQRSELQNALLLGKLLNRTVLLPPVWVGWPTSTQHYDDLSQAWTDAIVLNPSSFGLADSPPGSYFNSPAHFASTVADFPFPASAADDPELISARLAAKEKNAERWRALGWEVRPDGYPITNTTAAECKSYSLECRHTYKDSFLSWDWLVDLSKVEKEVKLVDRWDIRERALEELLGVTAGDVYVLSDRQVYDFKFTDKLDPSMPLIVPSADTSSHWARLVSLSALSQRPERVLLVGSLFGSGRISTRDPRAADLRAEFEQDLAFRNPWLLKPADEIRDRLGGSHGYVGVHARVGDGVFASHAQQNMERAWRQLVEKLRVDAEVVEEMWERLNPAAESDAEVVAEQRMRRVARRSLAGSAEQPTFSRSAVDLTSDWSQIDPMVDIDPDVQLDEHQTRARRLRRSALIAEPSFSPSDLTSLTCRSPRHTSDSLALFNTPLYLATDSRSPTSDPNLAIFFAAFPCTFILSDFDRPGDLNDGVVVSSIGDMTKLVNQADGMALGRLLLPFLEAIIAAKGAETVGTYGSTFSDFAQGGLHDAYALEN